MAHYAYLDENNVVTMVIVGRDEDDLVEGVTDWEVYYGAKRCSYNTYGGEHLHGGTPFRKNYPSIGFSYDPVRDAFIPPQPYASWGLNEQSCLWEPPIPYPGNDEDMVSGILYAWDEHSTSWVLVNAQEQSGA
jgi:hypothetical protein